MLDFPVKNKTRQTLFSPPVSLFVLTDNMHLVLEPNACMEPTLDSSKGSFEK